MFKLAIKCFCWDCSASPLAHITAVFARPPSVQNFRNAIIIIVKIAKKRLQFSWFCPGTSIATTGPRETFLLGFSGEKFYFLLFLKWRILVYFRVYIFERRRGPKRCGARGNLPLPSFSTDLGLPRTCSWWEAHVVFQNLYFTGRASLSGPFSRTRTVVNTLPYNHTM